MPPKRKYGKSIDAASSSILDDVRGRACSVSKRNKKRSNIDLNNVYPNFDFSASESASAQSSCQPLFTSVGNGSVVAVPPDVGHDIIIGGVSRYYNDLGDCRCVCSYCGAKFWYEERLRYSSPSLLYNRCCEGGRVSLPREMDPPIEIVNLLNNKNYMDNIRAYNQMFSMASYGAHVDEAVNDGRGPYVFKVSGQIYHWVGSLCPEEGNPPRFLQLYIYDTVNEVANRLRFFGDQVSGGLTADMVQLLLDVLNSNNRLVKFFRTARDKIADHDVPEVQIRLYGVVGSKQHELPTSDALGMIVFEPDATTRTDYDLILQYKGGTPKRVNKLHPLYMSLQFPLLFVYGQPGYHLELKLRNVTGRSRRKKDKMTMNMFYSYQLHDRYSVFNLLGKCGRLFQQFIVTAYCSIELDRIDYVRKKQQDIRNEYLSGLYDALDRGDRFGNEVGSRTILPASFTGGPIYMYSHYLDALAICRVYGNPLFFITFTCNTKWPEIQRYLRRTPHLTATDRADITARVFHMKVKEFESVLKQEEHFGRYRAVLYTIEFQKRGLPHCHTLLWVHNSARTLEPEEIDRYVSAELPNPEQDPEGFKVVSEFMIHGPCGLLNKSAPCMQEGKCTKKFPKVFENNTYFDKDGFVHYRRRNTGIYTKRGANRADNGYVVPYNRYLCLRFNAHINVECCGWNMLIKYLFKYISKGTDRIAARISRPIGTSSAETSSEGVDEIRNFIDARFICPHEASWRIFNFPIHYRDPAVQVLVVHLENMQLVSFRSTQQIRSVVRNPVQKKTTLTEWLYYNRNSSDGRHLTYLNFPAEFVWIGNEKRWKRRCNLNKPSIGRLAYMHPALGEVFYLRMLLCHQRGCRSFREIMTIDDTIYANYRETCLALGLLGDDREWTKAIEEASSTATASQLRSLFTHILIYCDVADPLRIWKQNWKLMSDDIPIRAAATLRLSRLHINDSELEAYVLYEIQILLQQYSKNVTDFGLPQIPQFLLDDLQNRLLMEEKNYDREALAADLAIMLVKMNEKQKMVYDLIVDSNNNNTQQLIFVYGHGGTGKTYLWKAITTSLRANGKIVLAVASSGIASLLLPSGQTAHSRFKIPIDLTDESMCNIKKKTHMATLLRRTELIIWDEIPMNDRKCLETLDRTLRDIYDREELPFGGLSMVLGGDFRQTLPVKKRASKTEILKASIIFSPLWNSFSIITLEENMRLKAPNQTDTERSNNEAFASWLLKIGDGKIGEPDDSDPDDVSWVQIPTQYCIPDTENGLLELINFIYDKNQLQRPTAHQLQQQAIVCPKNETADEINSLVLDMIDGDEKIYTSSDTAIPYSNDGGQTEMLYPTEYLNSQTFPSLPPHKLHLKIGTPIILMRNMTISGGLCNGTRMITTQLLPTLIEAEIITGTKAGQKVHLTRITLIYKDNVLPYVFKRVQYPVKLSYAMTINKSQGQSLNKIGIYLPKPVFGHGQLMDQQVQITPLALLQPGDRDRTIEVIVYRRWVAKKANSDIAHGFSCVFVDINGTAIQANMHINNREHFEQLLQVNTAFRISNFLCDRTKTWDKTITHPTTLFIGLQAHFQPIPAVGFPPHYFEFKMYHELTAYTVTDYIGCVQSIEEIVPNAQQPEKDRRSIYIIDLSDNTIELTLWGADARNFDTNAYQALPQPVIIAVSGCWVKKNKFNKRLQLSGISSTHIYLNPQIPEVEHYLPMYTDKFAQRPMLDPGKETYTLADLMLQNPRTYRNRPFKCIATIDHIITDRDWFYRGCPECRRQLIGTFPNLNCPDHDNNNNYILCYKFRGTISDNTSTATVTFFSNHADNLIGNDCTTMVTTMGYDNPQELPPAITNLRGTTHLMQLMYSHNDTYYPEFVFLKQYPVPTETDNISSPHAATPTGTAQENRATDTEKTPEREQPVTPAADVINITPMPTTPAETEATSHTETKNLHQSSCSTVKRQLFTNDEARNSKKKKD